MKIAVIAGTGDATELIQKISENHEITAFAATDYGKEILKNSDCQVHTGRRNEQEFCSALAGLDCLIDASHPFAEEVTRTVKKACEKLNIRYFRLLRPELQYDYAAVQTVASKEEACLLLSEMSGNILLTTGVQTLHFYETHVRDFPVRGWVRVLDTADSRRIAETSEAHVIYAVPPFSAQDTLHLIQKYQISVLVSKDSGSRGGLPAKINAARKAGIPVILLKRPEENGMNMQEILNQLNDLEEFLC